MSASDATSATSSPPPYLPSPSSSPEQGSPQPSTSHVLEEQWQASVSSPTDAGLLLPPKKHGASFQPNKSYDPMYFLGHCYRSCLPS